MRKIYLIYLPLILIFIIQIWDENDKFLVVQYLMLGIMLVALIFKLIKQPKNN